MLPPVGGMPADNEGVFQQQSSRRSGIFDNISNSISTSPKFFAQESLVKTLGNNFLTQGMMQIGSTLGSVLDRVVGQDDFQEMEPQQRGPGLADLDRNLFKEMLKTLLRIEENTEQGAVTPGIATLDAASNARDLEKIRSERRSAEDILERIKQKSPMQPLNRDQNGNIISEHYSDIGQNITNTAATGLYETLGYNILTQGAVDTLGLAGDLSSRLLDKFGKTASNEPNMAGEQSVDKAVLHETKESKTVLNSMLEKLTEISETFKRYFSIKDEPVSTLEDKFEEHKLGKALPAPALPKELLDKLKSRQEAVPAAAAGEEGLLAKAGHAAEVLHTLRDFKSGKAILGKLGSLASKISMPSMATMGTAAVAAAPLAAMAYAAHKAGDQTHDIENVEGLKEKSEGISGFFKKIGLDFSGRFEKQAAKNREGLNTTEELEAIKRASNVDALEKSAEKLREKEKESRRLLGDGIKQDIANITNINSQTVIPTRTTVRYTDTTANRYFDKALD